MKERAIYTRERAAGLSPGAYLASKLVVPGFISAVQAVVLVAIGLALLAIASMTAGGGVIRLNNMAGLSQLSWFSPSRWGFGAVSSTVDLNKVTPPPPGGTADPLWNHTPHTWFPDMGMQLALTVVLAVLTWWRLSQASPGRR